MPAGRRCSPLRAWPVFSTNVLYRPELAWNPWAMPGSPGSIDNQVVGQESPGAAQPANNVLATRVLATRGSRAGTVSWVSLSGLG